MPKFSIFDGVSPKERYDASCHSIWQFYETEHLWPFRPVSLIDDSPQEKRGPKTAL
jgi:hypothetical protein